MEMLELNSTPVRTAKNFVINNIALNVELPNNVQEFKNLEITKENADINSDTQKEIFEYGISDKFQQNVFENSNSKIKIENKEKANVKIVYNFDDNNLNLINQIQIAANADINVIIEYRSKTDKKCFHNAMITTTAKQNVKVNITIINLLNEVSDSFEAIENNIYANSVVKHTLIEIGAKNSVSNYYSNVLGENAQNDLKTIYLGKGEQLKDINYIVDLKGKKTNVDIDVQGALNDNSKKNFKGTINFVTGCKKAKGNENEYCMLLSDKAKSIALPMLLCTEDDVEGNHSTASGKVDEKQLFYIMSRGISYKQAVKLIVKSRFNSIIERITDENVKTEVLEEIDKRLD